MLTTGNIWREASITQRRSWYRKYECYWGLFFSQGGQVLLWPPLDAGHKEDLAWGQHHTAPLLIQKVGMISRPVLLPRRTRPPAASTCCRPQGRSGVRPATQVRYCTVLYISERGQSIEYCKTNAAERHFRKDRYRYWSPKHRYRILFCFFTAILASIFDLRNRCLIAGSTQTNGILQ